MSENENVGIVEQRQPDDEVEYGPEVSLATRLRIEREHLAHS